MTQIKNVTSLDEYRLSVDLDNGNSIILDFKSRLNTVRFALLTDTDFFRCVETDGTTIKWGNKIEISVSELFILASQTGRIDKECVQ